MKTLFANRGIQAKSALLPPAQRRPFYEDARGVQACAWPGSLPAAEALLGKPVPPLSCSLYRRFAVDGNRKEYETPYFQRRTALLTLTFAEKTEGKGRFVELLADYVWAVLEESTWVLPAHNRPRHGLRQGLPDAFGLRTGDELDYIDLFSATTAATLAWVSYLLAKELDGVEPVLRTRIRDMLELRILRPFLDFDKTMPWIGSCGETLNNWTPWIVSNILSVALVGEMDESTRQAVVDKSMAVLDRFTAQYGDDGGCDEGPSYWFEASAAYFDCLEILYDLSGGRIDFFGDPFVRRMGEYIADFHLEGEAYINFADAHHRLTADAELIARYGRRTGSAKLLGFAAQLRAARPRTFQESNGASPYRTIKNALEPLAQPVPWEPEASVYYPDLQVLIAREANTKLALAIKGGSNAESHNHNDIGSFLLFRGDRPVLIDVGVETYSRKTFSPERYSIWTMRSSYHNLPDINGVEQRADSLAPNEVPDPNAKGEHYFAVLAEQRAGGLRLDLLHAYPAQAGLLAYLRDAQLDPAGLRLEDALRLTSAGEVCWNFMLAEEPQRAAEGLRLSQAGCLLQAEATDAVGRRLPLEAEVETIALEDPKLRGEWGRDALYRLRLRAKGFREGKLLASVQAFTGK